MFCTFRRSYSLTQTPLTASWVWPGLLGPGSFIFIMKVTTLMRRLLPNQLTDRPLQLLAAGDTPSRICPKV
jgi:hypothetical protein